ncbi:hypothetical protein [Mammaliicoccus sciuri]|uniref:hypothetical protein n=1 Tax=Mammaliicoccus sciuri TaxID=1296 RepID=UPI000E69D761|nr:hypothetical protein [Mammaliicoccus sciuri]RIN92363.1 hypothetical protein BU003_01920 [Mammaliicoccus sciuri]RIN97144.1 hypothetical protein BU002_02160 [Mammaliicoccus sciuri]
MDSITKDKLFEAIWEYQLYEFYIYNLDELLVSDEEIKKYQKDLRKEIDNDLVNIAHSEFGENVTFQGETTFIPSELKVIKEIFCYESTDLFIENTIFTDLDDCIKYINNTNFDEFLQPNIDEKYLEKHFEIAEGRKLY